MNARLAGRRGITLAEVLITLVVGAILLAALALSTHAAVQSWEANRDLAQATQFARMAVSRVVSSARGADVVTATNGGNGISIQRTDGGGVTRFTTLAYSPSRHALWMYPEHAPAVAADTDGTADPNHTGDANWVRLGGNTTISAAQLAVSTAADGTCRLVVSLRVGVGSETIAIGDSVVVRRSRPAN